MALQNVLVVDDEPSVPESLIVALEDEYDITAVNSGEGALDLIPRSKFDLVLLDILMPGMDGVQTLKAIRETDDDLQVTLKPWRKFRRAERINLVEEKIGEQPIGPDGSVAFAARRHEIVTVHFLE